MTTTITTSSPTTDPKVHDFIAQLQVRYDVLGDGRDLKSDNEKATWFGARTDVANTVSGLMNAPSDLARVQAKLDDVVARREEHLAKRQELEAQAVAFVDPQTIADARLRDAEVERQRQVRRALERLSEGTLLKAPDVTFEPLAYLDQRIAELTDRRDRAQRALDGHLRQAEALLAEPVSS